jgi:P-aminobenzoate N-oxygenase AurF
MPARQRLEEVAARLSEVSRRSRYDPYTIFDWPAVLPPDQYWISPELMTISGTPLWDELSDEQRIRLSHHEAVSFFSLNVHLISELIGEVVSRIYKTGYPGLSEFFHDFIAEENVHSWFFATFCLRYGGKVYPSRKVILGTLPESSLLRDIAVFGRILIAEELCDFFNASMAGDGRLPAICQQINRVHHEDESRHIAFGRQMLRALRDEAAEQLPPGQLAGAGQYLARYMSLCLRSFYNPGVYRDAGLADPGRIRSELVASPQRAAQHRQALGRTVAFLERIQMLDGSEVRW